MKGFMPGKGDGIAASLMGDQPRLRHVRSPPPKSAVQRAIKNKLQRMLAGVDAGGSARRLSRARKHTSSREPEATVLEPPARVTCETRFIGTMPKIAAVTPVSIIRVSLANVLATQRLQQNFRGCRIIPISLVSPRNSFPHSEIRHFVKMYRLGIGHPVNPFNSIGYVEMLNCTD